MNARFQNTVVDGVMHASWNVKDVPLSYHIAKRDGTKTAKLLTKDGSSTSEPSTAHHTAKVIGMLHNATLCHGWNSSN